MPKGDGCEGTHLEHLLMPEHYTSVKEYLYNWLTPPASMNKSGLPINVDTVILQQPARDFRVRWDISPSFSLLWLLKFSRGQDSMWTLMEMWCSINLTRTWSILTRCEQTVEYLLILDPGPPLWPSALAAALHHLVTLVQLLHQHHLEAPVPAEHRWRSFFT